MKNMNKEKKIPNRLQLFKLLGVLLGFTYPFIKKIILKNKRKIIADYNFTIKLVKPW